MAMAMTAELAAMLTEREIDEAINRLAAKRAAVPPNNIDALAAIDGDITLLKTERAWRERMRRKYERDDET
jgi:hypothetical protein